MTFPGARVNSRGGLAAVAAAVALCLSACSTITGSSSSTQASRPAAPPPAVAQAPQPAPAPQPATIKAAILLPLSGPQAEVGAQLLNAAQTAVFDTAGDDFELLPRDTRGTPQGAAQAARQALADGAKVILGPLFAQEVQAVKPIAAAAGVEVLAFSTDWTVAGGGAHVLGFVPADQVGRVEGFAVTRGLKTLAVVAPSDPFGDAAASAAQATATRVGARLVSTERYDPKTVDFNAVALNVAKAPGPVQAVLFADSADQAKRFGAALAGAGVNLKSVRLLGTGRWDIPGIGKEPTLVGGWYAAADPALRADFERRFEAAFGTRPQRIATLAYDATALVATLGKLRGSAGLTRTELTGDSGFSGLDGLFRLRETGVVQRGLAVMEITPTDTRVVDPAPQSFDAQMF